MSAPVNDGGAAFPSVIQYFPEDTNYREEQGMTLRDHFAGTALQGMNANPELMQVVTAGDITSGTAFEKMASNAYQQADAMLRARDRKPRFESVSCSQCGCAFGPGNAGFSHCEDHAGVPKARGEA